MSGQYGQPVQILISSIVLSETESLPVTGNDSRGSYSHRETVLATPYSC